MTGLSDWRHAPAACSSSASDAVASPRGAHVEVVGGDGRQVDPEGDLLVLAEEETAASAVVDGAASIGESARKIELGAAESRVQVRNDFLVSRPEVEYPVQEVIAQVEDPVQIVEVRESESRRFVVDGGPHQTLELEDAIEVIAAAQRQADPGVAGRVRVEIGGAEVEAQLAVAGAHRGRGGRSRASEQK
jgi:hypothetical protein